MVFFHRNPYIRDNSKTRKSTERTLFYYENWRARAQLYTIRSYIQTEADFRCSMKKIADIGYKTVQISAIGKSIRPEAIREICDENGLSIVLTHSDPDRILNDTDALIKEHDILGCKYIGLGCTPEKHRKLHSPLLPTGKKPAAHGRRKICRRMLPFSPPVRN